MQQCTRWRLSVIFFIFLRFVWRILHMGVDRESSEGVVYIKTLSTEDAGKVFRSVSPGHCWYCRIFSFICGINFSHSHNKCLSCHYNLAAGLGFVSKQCSGSMTFWCGSGSGSTDAFLWLMESDPDPAIFVIGLQDAYKKPIKKSFSVY